MEYHDKVLKCSECGAEFVFTAGEQMFFADKGFKNEPKRCKSCKAKRAEGGGGHAAPTRSETKTNCSQCGKGTVVSFPHCEQLVLVSERLGAACPPPPSARFALQALPRFGSFSNTLSAKTIWSAAVDTNSS